MLSCQQPLHPHKQISKIHNTTSTTVRVVSESHPPTIRALQKRYHLRDGSLEMESIVVQAWVNDVNAALTCDNNTISTTTAASLEDMPSPTKRPRTSNYPDLRHDPEQTPTRAPVQLMTTEEESEDLFNDPQDPFTTAPSDYSYPAVLGSSAGFSVPFRFPPPATVTSRSRSVSPTKKFRKTADLLNLMPPVRFNTVSDFELHLPEDAHKLIKSLSAVEAKEAILPALLRNHPSLQSSKIRSHS